MYIRVFSDIHYEFDAKYNINNLWNPTELDTDKDTILILAGDLWYGKLSLEAIKKFNKRFYKVLIVFGNHDFWYGVYQHTINEYRELLFDIELDNIHLLHMDTIELDGHLFIGAPLWTNMNHYNPNVVMDAKYEMNADFSMIAESEYMDEYYRTIRTRWTPDDWLNENVRNFGYIKHVVENNKDKQIIVITHHAPTTLSVHERFKDAGGTNYYFVNNYEEFILDNPQIVKWIHGHVHNKVNVKIGETDIIANPRGYPREHSDFDEDSVYLLENKII